MLSAQQAALNMDPVAFDLTLGVAQTSANEYLADKQFLLDYLETLEHPPELKTEEDYRRARAVKKAVSSLECFAFNSKHPARDRIALIEDRWGHALYRYNQKRLIKDPTTKALARYLLWNRHFIAIDPKRVMNEARKRNILRRTENNQVMVIGLQMKVGDNVFRVDRSGRHHRTYCTTIGHQAFAVGRHYAQAVDAGWIEGLDLIDPQCNLTDVGDRKNSARPIHLLASEQQRVWGLFEAPDHNV